MLILAVVVALIVLFLVVVATRPADFRIARTVSMSVPPETPFSEVNDFHRWEGWSPWAKMDPAMKTTYSGPPQGTGSTYAWVGNSKVGQGRMTILESQPARLVQIKLEFLKPFQATNFAEFTFQPQGNQTAVTWSMTGKRNFMMKAMCMVLNMDKMLAGQFDQGLAQMKAIAESSKKVDSSATAR